MYTLTKKAASLVPYQPVEAPSCIHLDANESFFTISPSLLEPALHLPLNRYPDPAATRLCRAFAAYYGIDPAHIVAGNGSDELISVIFQAFLTTGQTFATIEPDFSMYAHAGNLAEARHISMSKNDRYEIDINKVIEICAAEKVKLLIFSNPCNPTSLVLSREQVRRLIRSVEALVVLDEAYMDFAGDSLIEEAANFDNLIILRTCSKAIGMAALRLGFAVAGERLAGVLRAAKSPYNVNAISQAAGAAILENKALLQGALAEILASQKELFDGLQSILAQKPGRFVLLPGQANFAALVMEDGASIQKKLLDRGVAVRYTGGLVRVTCGTTEENRLFLQKFGDILNETT